MFQAANDHSTSIQATTKSVHAETVRVVDEQIKDLDVQMEALDDFVTRARSENASHHTKHGESVQTLSSTVEGSYGNISTHFKATFDRVKALGGEMDVQTGELQEGIEPLGETLCQPLSNLREEVSSTSLQEYEPTGETPEKVQYQYPTSLPRTQAHEALIADLHDAPSATPTKTAPVVFADLDHPNLLKSPPRASIASAAAAPAPEKHSFSMSLREVNPNLTTNHTTNLTTNLTGSLMFDPSASTMSAREDVTLPLFKRSTRQRGAKKLAVAVEGRENVPPGVFSQSTSRRRSPRLH